MSFVRIELPDNKTPEPVRHIADAIHDAKVATLDIPSENRFQRVCQRALDARIVDRSYLGVTRTDDCIFVQITLKSGRTSSQKRALYRQIAAHPNGSGKN